MYKNLVEILKRKGITNKAYADYLGITEKTVWNKLQGKTEFTLGEALKTCALMPEYKMTMFSQWKRRWRKWKHYINH